MAFTQEDFESQEKEFASLKEEFSRLQSFEQTLKNSLGLNDQDMQNLDLKNLSPSEKQVIEEAQNLAKRAGLERAGQANIKQSKAKVAGAGRKGVIRL